MRNIVNRRIVIFLSIILVATLLVFLLARVRQSKQVGVIPKTGADYQNLTPGTSTEEDVIKKFGNPLKEVSQNGIKVLEYGSKSPNFNNEFSISNGTLGFIKTIIAPEDNISIST